MSKVKCQNLGISLIEMIVVIAIGVVLATTVIISFSSFRNSKIVDVSADQILSVINEARVKTVSSEDYSRFGVRFEANRVVFLREMFLRSRIIPTWRHRCLLWWK